MGFEDECLLVVGYLCVVLRLKLVGNVLLDMDWSTNLTWIGRLRWCEAIYDSLEWRQLITLSRCRRPYTSR